MFTLLAGVQPETTPVAAPANALKLTGQQYSGVTGVVDCGNVTLGPGDWTLFLATTMPNDPGNAQYIGGCLLQIGASASSLYTAASHLTLIYSPNYVADWTTGILKDVFFMTGKDDNGTSVSARAPADTYIGSGLYPTGIAGLAYQGDGGVHGIAICCRSGAVEFWDVTAARALRVYSDDLNLSDTRFRGITAQPMRIGGLNLPSQPNPTRYWGGSIQGVVIKNGYAAQAHELERLFNGEDARTVLNLQSSLNDRYWPGTVSGSSLTELIGSQNGTISGTGTSQVAGVLSGAPADTVTVRSIVPGQVIQAGSGSSTNLPVWGWRKGGATNIQVQVVQYGSTFPATGGAVVQAWQTVVSGAKNAQLWVGTILVNHPANMLQWLDLEVRWGLGGSWGTAIRLGKKFGLGNVVTFAGQSILQKFRDETFDNTFGRSSLNATVQNFLVSHYDFMPVGSSGLLSQTSAMGCQVMYPSYNFYGEGRFLERLAVATLRPAMYSNFAVGSQSITYYATGTDAIQRWSRFISDYRPAVIGWGNGQADTGMSQATRWAALDTLLANIDLAVARSPAGRYQYTFVVFPVNAQTAASATVGNGTIRQIDMDWVTSRAAMGKPVALSHQLLDAPTQDGVHPVDNDYGTGLFGSRLAVAAQYFLGYSAHGALGPVITGGTYQTVGGNTVVTLTLAQNGGGNLMTLGGGAPSGFEVSINGGSSYAYSTNAILSATCIQCTVSGTPTGSVLYRYLANGPGTVENGSSTTKAQEHTDQMVYDDRGPDVSGCPGYPVVSINNGVVATAATPTLPTTPAPPLSSTLGTLTGGTAPLSWTANTNGPAATSYNVKYRIHNVFSPASWTTFATGVTGTSSTVTGLTAQTAYEFAVDPVNGAGVGVTSTMVQGTTPVGVPAQIGTLVFSGQNGTSITVNWPVPAVSGAYSAAVTYKVETSTDGSTWSTFAATQATPYVQITGLTASTTYYVRVSGNNSAGTGAASTPQTTSSGATSNIVPAPMGVTNLIADFDPNNSSTVTKAGSNVTSIASGNGATGSATAHGSPTISTINSLSALLLHSASSDYLDATSGFLAAVVSALNAGTPITVVAVVNAVNTSSGFVMDAGLSTATNVSTRIDVAINNGGYSAIARCFDASNDDDAKTGTGFAAGATHVVVAQFQSGHATLVSLDHGTAAASGVTTSIASVASTFDHLFFGAKSSSSGFNYSDTNILRLSVYTGSNLVSGATPQVAAWGTTNYGTP